MVHNPRKNRRMLRDELGGHDSSNNSPATPSSSERQSSSCSDGLEYDLEKRMEALQSLSERTGMPVKEESGQRTVGPPANWTGRPPPKGSEVFVGSIPPQIYEPDLMPLFEEIGPIYEMRFMFDFKGMSRGFCFISFTKPEDAEKAIAKLDGYEIRPGRRIGVVKSRNNTRLYIGGVPYDKTQTEVLEELDKITEGIEKVVLPPAYTPDGNKKNRGFAFVEYESHKAACMARRKLIPNTIKVWGNRDVTVDWALDSPDVRVLHVQDLSPSITSEKLRAIFNKVSGNGVENVKVFQNYGFIHFKSRDQALAAKNQLHHTKIDGRILQIKWATSSHRHWNKGYYGNRFYRGYHSSNSFGPNGSKANSQSSSAPKSQNGASEARKNEHGVSEARKNQTGVSEARKNQTGVSEARKNQTGVSEARKNQTEVPATQKNQTIVSEAPKNHSGVPEARENENGVSEASEKRNRSSENPHHQNRAQQAPVNHNSAPQASATQHDALEGASRQFQNETPEAFIIQHETPEAPPQSMNPGAPSSLRRSGKPPPLNIPPHDVFQPAVQQVNQPSQNVHPGFTQPQSRFPPPFYPHFGFDPFQNLIIFCRYNGWGDPVFVPLIYRLPHGVFYCGTLYVHHHPTGPKEFRTPSAYPTIQEAQAAAATEMFNLIQSEAGSMYFTYGPPPQPQYSLPQRFFNFQGGDYGR